MTDDELKQLVASLAIDRKETDKQFKETAKQLKELGKQIGGLGKKFGSRVGWVALFATQHFWHPCVTLVPKLSLGTR